MNLNVRVQPKASHNSIEIAEDGTIRVRVTAPPYRGKANEAVVRLLTSRLSVTRSAVRIVRGHTSRNKVIRIEGLDRDDAIGILRGSA